MKKEVYIEGMMCKHCAANAQKALEGIDGIKVAKVDLKKKKATIKLDKEVENSAIEKAIADAGYTVTGIE